MILRTETKGIKSIRNFLYIYLASNEITILRFLHIYNFFLWHEKFSEGNEWPCKNVSLLVIFFTQVYNRYPYSKRRGLSGGKHTGCL